MQASPCFKGGEFSCISCHEMHLDSTTTESSAATLGEHAISWRRRWIRDAACLQCHKEMARELTAHTHHDAESSRAAVVTTATCRTRLSVCCTPCAVIRSPRLTCAKALTTAGRTPAIFVISTKRSRGRRRKLHDWYQQPVPEFRRTIKTISAAVQWLVKGDAGQRALIAWGMGWETGAENLRTRLALSLSDLQPARSLCRGPFRCLEIVADIAGL